MKLFVNSRKEFLEQFSDLIQDCYKAKNQVIIVAFGGLWNSQAPRYNSFTIPEWRMLLKAGQANIQKYKQLQSGFNSKGD